MKKKPKYDIKKRFCKKFCILAGAAAIILFGTGCQNKASNDNSSHAETEFSSKTHQASEPVGSSGAAEIISSDKTDTAKEGEDANKESGIGSDGVYRSEKGNFEIILPDNNWEVTEGSSQSMTILSSTEGMIVIIQESGESVRNIPKVAKTEEEYKSDYLAMGESDPFDIVEYEVTNEGETQNFKIAVKYTSEETPYEFSYMIGSHAEETYYNVSMLMVQDNQENRSVAKDTVSSFRILK